MRLLFLIILFFPSLVNAGQKVTGNLIVVDGGLGIGASGSAYVITPLTTTFVVSGNVGIGTQTPQSKFQVRAATNENFIVQGHQLISTGVAIASINDANGANLPLELRGSRIVLSQGNVGIGSVNPGQILDIGSGAIRAVGIGTTVPQPLCRKSDGTFGYYNGVWAGTCS